MPEIDTISIDIRLAEPYWRSVGYRELRLDLPPRSRVSDLLIALFEAHPSLEQEMESNPGLIFIGDVEVDPDSLLADGDRVHFIWPIAGGSLGRIVGG